ncbi:hypothetical protein O3G_MSEX009728 [Manduca sexta]|uniref:Proteasome-associated protein ECM29 homolog n=1 Tax=Manduca sexta TaxID=7130 RepID=A0A921ZEN5_MANSE|nr:hypothetical protein O3G_MSEX009728 [Manduca sexta]
MSEMDVTDSGNECSNDLMLLDRVFLRLGNADTDEQLEGCLGRFLPPVILKLSSPHEQVRTKVMELLVHVNKRVKCRTSVQLPVQTLLQLYKDPISNSFIINFSIIYITLGFPRLPRDQQLSLAPTLLEAIENRPQGHQDNILILLMPLLGDIKETDLNLKDKPKVSSLILKFATDVLLLPYRLNFSIIYITLGFPRLPRDQQLSLAPTLLEAIENRPQGHQDNILILLMPLLGDIKETDLNLKDKPKVSSLILKFATDVLLLPYRALPNDGESDFKVPPGMSMKTYKRIVSKNQLNPNQLEEMKLSIVNFISKDVFSPNEVLLTLIVAAADSRFSVANHANSPLIRVNSSVDWSQPSVVAPLYSLYLGTWGGLNVPPDDRKVAACTRLRLKLIQYLNKATGPAIMFPHCVQVVFSSLFDPNTNSRLRNLALVFLLNVINSGDGNQLRKVSSVFLQGLLKLIRSEEHAEHHTKAYTCLGRLAMKCADTVSNQFALLEELVKKIPDAPPEIRTALRDAILEMAVTYKVQFEEKPQPMDTSSTPSEGPSTSQEKMEVDDNNVKKTGRLDEPQALALFALLEHYMQSDDTMIRYVAMRYAAVVFPPDYVPSRYLLLLASGDSQDEISTEALKCLYGTSRPSEIEDVVNNVSTKETAVVNLDEDVSKKDKDQTSEVPAFKAPPFKDVVNYIWDQLQKRKKGSNAKHRFVVNNQVLQFHPATYKEILRYLRMCLNRDANLKDCSNHPNANSPLLTVYINDFLLDTVVLQRYLSMVTALLTASPAKGLAGPQVLLVSTSCSAVAVLVRCSGLPLPTATPNQEALLQSDNPFSVNKPDADDVGDVITKFTVADRLFRIVGNAKLPSKLKEKALRTVGLMCCGERLPFAKQIVMGFLQMAKDSKEFEIHLQIGESLVLCVEGVNSNENRDMWKKYEKQGLEKIKDKEALKENDELLEWLLGELFKIGKHPHPHSRQATSIWLLALLKNCPEREPIKNKLQELQNVFMDFLSENSDIVQDVASKGLSLVYQNSDESQKQALVGQIIDQLTSGKRAVAQVTDDTKIFEEGQLGKAPTGGNLSTYKELCSLASDLNKPDLLYKFMHLAHHNSVWNSKKGAAFGFHSIALQAGAQLSEHLPKIVPRLYRYRFDPTPRIQNSMASIWQAIVPNTQATVQKYHKEILDDLVANLTSNQWRVRMSCCNALADLLRGAQSLHDSLEQLPTIWSQLFRVMDDVHEGTRQAATTTANVLSKLCIRASDVNQGKDGKEVVAVILPVLLETGITNIVKEVRAVSLQTVSKLVSAAGASLKPFLWRLVPALVGAAGELESAKLSYLSTALVDSGSRELLDDMRASAAKHHYTTDTVVKCMPYVDIEVVKEMLPKILELTKSPQLGTKVACCHFIILAGHYLRAEMEPVAGKIMSALLNGTFDRNATVRKNYAEALGQISAYAKPQSAEKLMKKLVNLYETKEDDMSRSAIALTLKSVAKAKIEHIKNNEEVLAPTVFLAMHAPKDNESSTVEMFEEIWTDISPTRESGIKQHLPLIREQIEEALNSSSWTKKVQAANAIKTICKEMSSGLGDQREQFIRALLAAVHGKTFDGKQNVIEALAELCAVKEGESPVSQSLASECLSALLVECRKQEMVYKKHAIAALGAALAATHCDRFHQVYEIVKAILSKNELTLGKESDEEDNEGARQRREQLTALKEAAYELLGKAWPKEADTQEKYRDVFFEHCASSYASSSRSTQLAILSSIARILERLAILSTTGEAMETDNSANTNSDKAISTVVDHVVSIVDYTLKNSNQVRHRRDALNIMEILIKQLKDLNKTEELTKLRSIYQTYAQDLSKDSSHEIRTKVANIKVQFKK